MRTWRPLASAQALAERHPRVAWAIEQVGPPEIPQRPSTFASLGRAIAYQQLTGKAAGTIWGRVLDLFPRRRIEPAALLRKRETTLRGAGLSRAKVAALRDLARHVVDGRLDPKGLRRLDDAEVEARLVQVRGIGPWSAHMHLMFSLARPDVWPTGDLGVRKGLARIFELDATPEARAAAPLGDPFVGHRSVLAWYCWRILDVDDAS